MCMECSNALKNVRVDTVLGKEYYVVWYLVPGTGIPVIPVRTTPRNSSSRGSTFIAFLVLF